MNFKRVKNDILLILQKNDDLFECIQKFAMEHNINNAFINGIGALNQVELGYSNLTKKEYQRRNFDKDLELLSLNGNITLVDNQPFLHIHTVLSDEDFHCIGGHLFRAKVAVTCEIRLTVITSKVQRVFNNEIGLKLIQCSIR